MPMLLSSAVIPLHSDIVWRSFFISSSIRVIASSNSCKSLFVTDCPGRKAPVEVLRFDKIAALRGVNMGMAFRYRCCLAAAHYSCVWFLAAGKCTAGLTVEKPSVEIRTPVSDVIRCVKINIPNHICSARYKEKKYCRIYASTNYTYEGSLPTALFFLHLADQK